MWLPHFSKGSGAQRSYVIAKATQLAKILAVDFNFLCLICMLCYNSWSQNSRIQKLKIILTVLSLEKKSDQSFGSAIFGIWQPLGMEFLWNAFD